MLMKLLKNIRKNCIRTIMRRKLIMKSRKTQNKSKQFLQIKFEIDRIIEK